MTADPWIWRQEHGRFHIGLDIGAPTGTPVYAAADGTLRTINPNLEGEHALYCPDQGSGDDRKALYEQVKTSGQGKELENGVRFPRTLGVDRAYDTRDFVWYLRALG